MFLEVFPNANELQHQALLEAAATYPAFCNGKIGKSPVDIDHRSLCKRELAAFLAHVIAETNGLEDPTVLGKPYFNQGLVVLSDPLCQSASLECNYYPADNKAPGGWMVDD